MFVEVVCSAMAMGTSTVVICNARLRGGCFQHLERTVIRASLERSRSRGDARVKPSQTGQRCDDPA